MGVYVIHVVKEGKIYRFIGVIKRGRREITGGTSKKLAGEV